MGVLEAGYDPAPAPAGIQAVLCHPHPQYGGNRHDGVLDCLARVLRASGVGCLRFNFRGVGGSSGTFDGGRGEIDDLLATIAWIDAEYPDDALWLGGYSFGAHVVWQAQARLPRTRRIVLLAPPVGLMDFSAAPPACPVDVFAGDADTFVDPERLTTWPGVSAHVLPGADHFFSGQWQPLMDRIARAVTPPGRPQSTDAPST